MAPLGRPKATLALSEHERTILAATARAMRRNRHEALRARIILACHSGLCNREVAARMGLAEHTVGKWRARFIAQRLAGLCNAAPSGAKETMAEATWRHLDSAQHWLLGTVVGLRRRGVCPALS